MFAEQKTMARTKRRRETSQGSIFGSSSSLSTRVSRLAKKMKVNNPTHLYSFPGSTWVPTNTTSIVDLCGQIAQGDDYFNRFSSSVMMTHVNISLVAQAGTTAAQTGIIRITMFRAASGTVFAANLQGSYSPIVTGTSSRLIWDRHYEVASTLAAAGFPTIIRKSLKVKHQQKFSGTVAGTTTGDCIFLIIQSNFGAGTAAPALQGVVEVFFQPM